MRRIPNALAWPAAWTVNAFAQKSAAFYIDALTKAFPLRVIQPPIPFVNAVSELLADALGSPATPVRSLARKVFDTINTPTYTAQDNQHVTIRKKRQTRHLLATC